MIEKVIVFARGHENIRAEHRTTLEITRDEELSPRGDCIIGVGADKALVDFPERFKRLARHSNAVITLVLRAGNREVVIRGRGHERLSFTDAREMVVRKSTFTCGRTLMVGASHSARELPRDFVALLRNPAQRLIAEITVELPAQNR
ncbi:DUF371 domain-containing protein [Candidatus Pyrohabitans sp.]